jgi:hypothetical protein
MEPPEVRVKTQSFFQAVASLGLGSGEAVWPSAGRAGFSSRVVAALCGS